MRHAHSLHRSAQGGFWLRFVASFVDALILVIPNILIQRSSGILFGSEAGPFVALGMNSFLGFIYYAPLQAFYLGTPGKRIVGLILVNQNLERMTLSQSIARYAMSMVSALAFGLGYFWVAWDKNKQAWHDKVAGTFVVRKDALKQSRGATVHALPTRNRNGVKKAA